MEGKLKPAEKDWLPAEEDADTLALHRVPETSIGNEDYSIRSASKSQKASRNLPIACPGPKAAVKYDTEGSESLQYGCRRAIADWAGCLFLRKTWMPPQTRR